MVTTQQVWDALAEVPDPEIPVISIVDLGVIRSVDVSGAQVRALGAEPEIEVVLDDSWSTDRITAAGREKLRAAGFAPPAPREASAPTLIQLQSSVFRCPYCGSTETKLENIFGPTPCRSLRYCETCRQPFEQFKTI